MLRKLTPTAGILVLATAVASVALAAHTPPTKTGVVREYHLYATDGYVTMQDGTIKYVFAFNDTGVLGQAVFPAPLIWANVGDEIHLKMTNLGMKYRPDLLDPHTVHLHGIHTTPYFDGFPETSFGIPMGETFTYKMVAQREGTYIYHCHVEAVEHVHMGMYGPLVVYKDDSQAIHGKSYTKEYIWMLSEIDSRWHRSMEPQQAAAAGTRGRLIASQQTDPPITYDQWVRVNFRPDYWLINGLGFPDTLRTAAELPLVTTAADGTKSYQKGIVVCNREPGLPNPAHPGLEQGSMLDVEPDEAVLVRMINIGFQAHPIHAHCSHFEVLGSDATPLPNVQASNDGKPYYPSEKFTVAISSGETYDLLYTLHGALIGQQQAMVQQPETSPFPAEDGAFYNKDGYMWWPSHCHDDYHVADQGIYPTGMLTLIRAPVSSIEALGQ